MEVYQSSKQWCTSTWSQICCLSPEPTTISSWKLELRLINIIRNHQEVSRCSTRCESQESIMHRWWTTQARDPPWLWNLGETSPEVQNRGISGHTKRLMPSNFFFKKTKYVTRNVGHIFNLIIQLELEPGSRLVDTPTNSLPLEAQDEGI